MPAHQKLQGLVTLPVWLQIAAKDTVLAGQDLLTCSQRRARRVNDLILQNFSVMF